MSHVCYICTKTVDDMIAVRTARTVESGYIEPAWLCIQCADAIAGAKELYPGTDNLVPCPRCGNDMSRNQAVCGNCRREINAYLYE